jgi:flagellar biosynthesis protein FlhA
MGVEFQRQMFGASQPLLLASGILFALAAFPGLPKIPFIVMGAGLGTLGWRLRKSEGGKEMEATAAPATQQKENLEDLLRVEPLTIEVGVSLVSFIAEGSNSPLLRRVAAIRRQLAGDLGFIIPPVRVNDNLTSLRAREYAIFLKGMEVARFELLQGCDLAIAVSATERPPEGYPTKDPVFGVNAWWVPVQHADMVRAMGYTTVDALSVLTTHFAELVKRYSHELFTRQEARKALDRVAADQPKVVEDLVPKLLPLATVQKVFQNLLRERVSIRDAASVLEALGEAGPATRNPVLLTDYVRQSIRRVIAQPFLNGRGEMPAWFLDPQLEHLVESGVEQGENASSLALPPAALRDLIDRFHRAIGLIESPVAVIVSSTCRFFLRQALESTFPHLFFLAHNEVPAGVKVHSLGVVQ